MTSDPNPRQRLPPITVEQQVAQIQMKLAEHTIGSDRDTHAVDHPVWIEEEKP